jgi:hypothetical protein
MRAYTWNTDQQTRLTGYIDSFEITLDDQVLIDNGASFRSHRGNTQ